MAGCAGIACGLDRHAGPLFASARGLLFAANKGRVNHGEKIGRLLTERSEISNLRSEIWDLKSEV